MKWTENNETASKLQNKQKDNQSTVMSSWIQHKKASSRVWVIFKENLTNAIKHQKLWIKGRRKCKVIRPNVKGIGEVKRHNYQRPQHPWKGSITIYHIDFKYWDSKYASYNDWLD